MAIAGNNNWKEVTIVFDFIACVLLCVFSVCILTIQAIGTIVYFPYLIWLVAINEYCFLLLSNNSCSYYAGLLISLFKVQQWCDWSRFPFVVWYLIGNTFYYMVHVNIWQQYFMRILVITHQYSHINIMWKNSFTLFDYFLYAFGLWTNEAGHLIYKLLISHRTLYTNSILNMVPVI